MAPYPAISSVPVSLSIPPLSTSTSPPFNLAIHKSTDLNSYGFSTETLKDVEVTDESEKGLIKRPKKRLRVTFADGVIIISTKIADYRWLTIPNTTKEAAKLLNFISIHLDAKLIVEVE